MGLIFGFMGVLFLLSVGALAMIAYPVLVAPGRREPVRCARGRMSYILALAGYFLGGFPSTIMCDPPIPRESALIGLVGGVVLGNVVGRILVCALKLDDEEARA